MLHIIGIFHVVYKCACTLPADFPRLEVTLDPDMLFSTVAAEIRVVVTDITLLTLLHNLVSTDGLIADWPKAE